MPKFILVGSHGYVIRQNAVNRCPAQLCRLVKAGQTAEMELLGVEWSLVTESWLLTLPSGCLEGVILGHSTMPCRGPALVHQVSEVHPSPGH